MNGLKKASLYLSFLVPFNILILFLHFMYSCTIPNDILHNFKLHMSGFALSLFFCPYSSPVCFSFNSRFIKCIHSDTCR